MNAAFQLHSPPTASGRLTSGIALTPVLALQEAPNSRMPWPRQNQRRLGFSLVEISLALAIVSFAFVAMLGLLAPGLSNFNVALNTQTAAEIYQRVAADAQETDFDTLLDSKVSAGGTGGQFYQLPLRYFDGQGQEVRVNDPANPTPAEKAKIVYTVRVRGSMPGVADPSQHSANYFTSIPGLKAPRFNPRDLTFLTVQVMATQGRAVNGYVDTGTYLIKTDAAAKAGLGLKTYSLVVARNGYEPKS